MILVVVLGSLVHIPALNMTEYKERRSRSVYRFGDSYAILRRELALRTNGCWKNCLDDISSRSSTSAEIVSRVAYSLILVGKIPEIRLSSHIPRSHHSL